MQTKSREIWKDIKGYEKLYQISNLGRVRSLNHIASKGVKDIMYKGKILKPFLDGKKNYLQVCLSKNNQKKKFLIHRLVAETFIDNFEHKREVNHKDGNKQNNCVDNLEWVTSKENKKHAWENGYYDTDRFKIRKSLKNSKKITINGITKSLYKWSKELDYSYNQLRWLYDKGGDLPNGWKRKSI